MRAENMQSGFQESGWIFAAKRLLAAVGRALDAFAAHRMRHADRALRWHGLSLAERPSALRNPPPKRSAR